MNVFDLCRLKKHTHTHTKCCPKSKVALSAKVSDPLSNCSFFYYCRRGDETRGVTHREISLNQTDPRQERPSALSSRKSSRMCFPSAHRIIYTRSLRTRKRHSVRFSLDPFQLTYKYVDPIPNIRSLDVFHLFKKNANSVKINFQFKFKKNFHHFLGLLIFVRTDKSYIIEKLFKNDIKIKITKFCRDTPSVRIFGRVDPN